MAEAPAQLGWRNYANLGAFLLNTAVTYASLAPWFPGETNTDLSAKYQTLITPDGLTFAIWAGIFTGEGVFAVAQMLSRYRGSKVVRAVTPGWLFACVAQICWTVFFSQNLVPASLVAMVSILAGLMFISDSTDGMAMSWEEYFVLRWAFSLHLGWIICASAVNANTLADFDKLAPETLLGLAVTSIGALCILGCVFSLVKKSPEPLVNLVAAWAFAGIVRELSDPELLNSPDRHNPYIWDEVTLNGFKLAASNLSNLNLGLAAVAVLRAVWIQCRGGHGADSLKSGEHAQELVASAAQGA